ncbi:MAG: hypothetical protein M9932_04945 [Xanthobacteraceae bacterium]|nr:hypothetical protein [Xanthobacteraceae bacterium]
MDDGPDEIEALLPWHAAGTLSAAMSRRVEDALARDAGLRRQFAAVREELAETVALNESLGAPSAGALRSLMAAIDAEPARAAAAPVPPRRDGPVTRFFAALSPRTLAWSASFGAMALLLQAGLIGVILTRSGLEAFQSADYRQAAEPATAAREGGSGTSADPAHPPRAAARAPQPSGQTDQARPGGTAATDPTRQPPKRSINPADTPLSREVVAAVTFRPDARMSDIAALLGSYQASVIGSAGGALQLRFAGMTSAADLNVILAALSKERIVAAAVAVP